MDVKRYEANYIPYEGLDLSGACAEMHGRFFVHMEDFDRVTAERNALQLRLNAVEDENDRLRSVLKEITEIEDELYGDDWEEIEKAREIAKSALEKRP